LTRDQLHEAHALAQDIRNIERLIAAYREAEEVLCSTGRPVLIGSGYENQLSLPADEIGAQVVAALQRRLAVMQASLRELGVEP
jgi:hypothetical protein